jgi:hypothetical protein
MISDSDARQPPTNGSFFQANGRVFPTDLRRRDSHIGLVGNTTDMNRICKCIVGKSRL